MALHRNQWSPDTCGCVIEFEFDDELPAEQRVHTGKRIVQRCGAHQETDFSNCHDQYSTVLEENQRKNITISHAMGLHPHITQLDENGNPILKRNIFVNYSFKGKGKNRVLEIAFEGADLENLHKKQIDTVNERKFGKGKVVVK